MKHLASILLLLGLSLGSLAAAANPNLVLNVSFVINGEISISWADDIDGTNAATGAQSWDLTAVSVVLGTTYNSDTHGTQPTKKFIFNTSGTNLVTDIAVVASNSTGGAGMTVANAINTDTFRMGVSNADGGQSQSDVSVHASVAEFVNALAADTGTGPFTFYLTMPDQISVGLTGQQQDLTVTFTASAN